ncbi:MAG: hypothetical protein IT167_12085 [Bryobacterales bacterium]|nr:hypothetical protein [Bryobacterales bacterium]
MRNVASPILHVLAGAANRSLGRVSVTDNVYIKAILDEAIEQDFLTTKTLASWSE